MDPARSLDTDSWHDDGAAKYAALASWSASFEKEHRRSPVVWLDKASINQDDIEASLACLPVYLAGCNTLLVLAGPTYTERLWCIVEVFTYLRMGGAPERMIVVPLAGARLDFSSFDAEKAKCYSPEDKRKLLQAITLAFGSCEPFNLLVRSMLASRADESAIVQAVPQPTPPPTAPPRTRAPPSLLSLRGTHNLNANKGAASCMPSTRSQGKDSSAGSRTSSSRRRVLNRRSPYPSKHAPIHCRHTRAWHLELQYLVKAVHTTRGHDEQCLSALSTLTKRGNGSIEKRK